MNILNVKHSYRTDIIYVRISLTVNLPQTMTALGFFTNFYGKGGVSLISLAQFMVFQKTTN